MPKHFFFDLDKTLTASRSPMEPSHQEIFDVLCGRADVAVVTGGTIGQIREQVTPRFDGRYFILAQSGNQAVLKDGTIAWDEKLNDAQARAVDGFIRLLRDHFNIPVRDENDLVENRGAQIAFSVIGFHEDIAKKYAFDPTETRRQEALEKFANERLELLAIGVEVVPAGTTNFSFIPAGNHKGFNVGRFVSYMDWKNDECLYIGDALFPGGNDESVNGVVPTRPVSNPHDTFSYLHDVLS